MTVGHDRVLFVLSDVSRFCCVPGIDHANMTPRRRRFMHFTLQQEHDGATSISLTLDSIEPRCR